MEPSRAVSRLERWLVGLMPAGQVQELEFKLENPPEKSSHGGMCSLSTEMVGTRQMAAVTSQLA